MSFDAWVVGFGFSRVLIELNLMESPWAYGVLILTFLIDTSLLYIFFTRRAALRRSQRTLLTPGAPSGRHNRVASDMIELQRDPFGPLLSVLGYIIGIAAIAMLIYTFFPAMRDPPRPARRDASSPPAA
jgi:hypothetical protein